ncbi:MAG: hypothetical protein U9N59_13565 [Campylobacterota bacterium]|nr:hypothetical protein [Campylobacterota bacterium]
MNLNKLKDKLESLYADELKDLYISIKRLLDKNIVPKDITLKRDLVSFFIDACKDEEFITNFRKNILERELIYLYDYLIWQNNSIGTSESNNLFGIKLPEVTVSIYERMNENLSGIGFLIQRSVSKDYSGEFDDLHIDETIQYFLRQIAQKPDDYYIKKERTIIDTKYNYKNENEILEFIETASEMLKNNLIVFGKNSEKPMVKSLNFLKSATPINEFFTDKKLNILAADMLTRSFSFYYWSQKKFKEKEYESLHEFISLQFDNKLPFFISRLFTTHLKKVRFDFYYSSQNGLFDIVKLIMNHLPRDGFVSMDNILNFCKYRDIKFHFDSPHKTYEYRFESNVKYTVSSDMTKEYNISDKYYYPLFFEPIIKALFFYLGALGIVELKYDDPATQHDIKAKDKDYISIWDGLKYIKLTQLGHYVLGYEKNYTQKKIEKQQKDIKFDEYKPIITIDKSDTILLSQIEPYTLSYDTNRYILNYNKIFRDCKNLKALELKMDSFHKLFNSKLPKVFDDFFEEIKTNSNMLKRDLKLITIELKNNKKLLNLFMTNKKLQELTIKASGYRILILKDDMAKLTKIVKDNGFFIEF